MLSRTIELRRPESLLLPMKPTLYERDYYQWLTKTAELLRNKDFSEVDLSNLVEELESMGRSEKHAIQNNLIVVLQHLLKYKYQPQRRTSSWLSSIVEHRDRLEIALADSPSLRPYINEVFDKCYSKARRRAATETELPINTFPDQPPFTVEEVLDVDYLPD